MPETQAPKLRKLTPLQQRFVDEYLIDLNATQAYIRAGYKSKTPSQDALKVKEYLHVQAAIEAGRKELADKTKLTAQKVIDEIGKLAFANMADYIKTQADGSAYVDLAQLTRDQAAAIQEVTVDTYTEGRGDDAREVKRIKFKLADKGANLERLGKHFDIFREKDTPPPPATFPSYYDAIFQEKIVTRTVAIPAGATPAALPPGPPALPRPLNRNQQILAKMRAEQQSEAK